MKKAPAVGAKIGRRRPAGPIKPIFLLEVVERWALHETSTKNCFKRLPTP